jgi:hypothetical protein
MKTGRYNVGVGLLVMAAFMLYGFLLIYLRDFAPDKEAWVASYSVGKHFEARLAHVHGNLFALLNLALGFVLVRLVAASDRARATAAVLGLTGLLMPVGLSASHAAAYGSFSCSRPRCSCSGSGSGRPSGGGRSGRSRNHHRRRSGAGPSRASAKPRWASTSWVGSARCSSRRARASPSARSSRASRPTRLKPTFARRRPGVGRRARRCSGSPQTSSARGRSCAPPSGRRTDAGALHGRGHREPAAR